MGAFKSIYTDYACEPSQTLVSPKLTLEANSAGSLEFSVLPGQDGYNNIYTAPRNGYLVVLKDGEPIWDGRVTTRDMDWNNSKAIYAEGALSYLNDIMIQSLEDTSDFKTVRANAQTDLKKKESAYNKAKKEWEDGGSAGTGDLYNKYITAKKNLGCAKKNYANCAYNANILDPTDDELLLELIEDDYYGENGPKIFEMMLEKYNAQAENNNVHNQFALGDVFVPAIHEAYEAVDEDDYLIEWDSPDFTTVYEYFNSMLEKIPNTYLSVTYEYDENNLLVRKLNWLLQGVNQDNVKTVKQYYNTNVKTVKEAYNTAAETYNKWYVSAYKSAKDAEDIDATIKSNSEYASKHNPLVTATNNLKTVNAAWNTYIKSLVDYSSPDIVVKQTVNFGENLLDFKRNIDSTEMFTRLIPIGEDDLYLNDDKSSNAIYVQDNELVAQYGVITRKMNFDKIRDVKTLKQQAKAELAKMKARIDGSKESIEITALDLRYLDSTAYYGKSLNIYDVVDCISAPHGFLTSNKFPVLKEEIDMAQPENTKFTLNAITEYQSATSQLASTSASAMATASTVSTLGSRQNSNIAYIDDGGGGGGTGGDGNKIYTSTADPDETAGNEGDMWVKYAEKSTDNIALLSPNGFNDTYVKSGVGLSNIVSDIPTEETIETTANSDILTPFHGSNYILNYGQKNGIPAIMNGGVIGGTVPDEESTYRWISMGYSIPITVLYGYDILTVSVALLERNTDTTGLKYCNVSLQKLDKTTDKIKNVTTVQIYEDDFSNTSGRTYSVNISNLEFDYIGISFANSRFRINSIAVGKSSKNYEIKTVHAKCENTWLLATDKEGEKYLAGDNITISSDNIISAKDTTYNAGQGISIDANNTISANNINEVALYESPQKNIRFGIDADGNYGYYKDGADTVTPFKTGGVQPDDYNSKRLLKIWGTDNGVMTLNPRFAMSQLFFNTNTNVTLILAFKASDIGGWKNFFQLGNDVIRLVEFPSNKMYFIGIGSNRAIYSSNGENYLSSNKDLFIALRFNGSTAQIYCNGAVTSYIALSWTPSNYINNSSVTSCNIPKGFYAFEIYDGVLTDDELLDRLYYVELKFGITFENNYYIDLI